MPIKLEVDYDSFDAAVVSQLKDAIGGLLDKPWEFAHDYKETLRIVDGMLATLEWYSTPAKLEGYKEIIKSQYDDLVTKAYPPVTPDGMNIHIIDYRELPNGEANMEFECNDKMKEFLIGVGLKQIYGCSRLGLLVSTVLRKHTYGKVARRWRHNLVSSSFPCPSQQQHKRGSSL
jgi:hypothetical protein